MRTTKSASPSKLINLDKFPNIKNKILRDAFTTKGDNKLNPYKNRGPRWSWPVILLKDETPPTGWKNAKLLISGRGSKCRFLTKYRGWGYYVKNEDWSSKLDYVKRKGWNIKKGVGRFKVGIPYEEAAKKEDCISIALTLAYQAHRILGLSDEEIRKKYPKIFEAIKDLGNIKEPICPFCRDPLNAAGFVELTEDTTDVFYKRKEAEDNAIQMFHIECLKPGKFLHKPGNVSWGHRRCNVAVSQHDVSEAEDWFIRVVTNRGWKVSR